MTTATKEVEFKPVVALRLQIPIEGSDILVTEPWTKKATEEMEGRVQKKAKGGRKARVPKDDFLAAQYRCEGGGYGIPAIYLKRCIAQGARFLDGITMTMARQAIFVVPDCYDEKGQTPLVRMTPAKGDPTMRTDMVRNKNGAPDVRYRPQFRPGWTAEVTVEYAEDTLSPEQIVALASRGGFHIGICSGRPEVQTPMDWGRFKIVTNGGK